MTYIYTCMLTHVITLLQIPNELLLSPLLEQDVGSHPNTTTTRSYASLLRKRTMSAITLASFIDPQSAR